MTGLTSTFVHPSGVQVLMLSTVTSHSSLSHAYVLPSASAESPGPQRRPEMRRLFVSRVEKSLKEIVVVGASSRVMSG